MVVVAHIFATCNFRPTQLNAKIIYWYYVVNLQNLRVWAVQFFSIITKIILYNEIWYCILYIASVCWYINNGNQDNPIKFLIKILIISQIELHQVIIYIYICGKWRTNRKVFFICFFCNLEHLTLIIFLFSILHATYKRLHILIYDNMITFRFQRDVIKACTKSRAFYSTLWKLPPQNMAVSIQQVISTQTALILPAATHSFPSSIKFGIFLQSSIWKNGSILLTDIFKHELY